VTHPWLEALAAEFAERLRGGRMAHAVLLSGPAGLGKVELARGFMAGLLCLEETYPACGACRSCQLLRTGAHPEGHVLTFEQHPRKNELRKELVVDQVRRLTAALQLTSTLSRRKAALVYPAESMNASAANALLKTLEEPPGDAVLILIAHNPSRLPATVRSRCQALNARLPDTELAVPWLVRASGSPEPAAVLALEAAAGSPLRALRMLEEDAVGPYRDLTETLDSLREGRCEPAAALATLSDVDPELLWAWLSLRAAKETRSRLGCGRVARDLASLQLEADRNRGLVATPVRQDLLLQDWLIQWSRLSDQGLRQREST
jgi:DNA polymerase-3 subunit delta'